MCEVEISGLDLISVSFLIDLFVSIGAFHSLIEFLILLSGYSLNFGSKVVLEFVRFRVLRIEKLEIPSLRNRTMIISNECLQLMPCIWLGS